MDFKKVMNAGAVRTPEEKKKELFLRQKELLETFLAHHAISRQQYEKSLRDMSEKMGMR